MMDVSRNMQFSFVLIGMIIVFHVSSNDFRIKRPMNKFLPWNSNNNNNERITFIVKLDSSSSHKIYVFYFQWSKAHAFDQNLTALQQNYDLQVLNPKSATYTAYSDTDFSLFTKWSNWSKCSRKCLTRRFRWIILWLLFFTQTNNQYRNIKLPIYCQCARSYKLQLIFEFVGPHSHSFRHTQQSAVYI